MGVNEPQYTWIKGLESETDDKFRLILGSYDSSISKNKLIEISPDKSIRFFGSVIMDQFTMSPGSLNGNSIQMVQFQATNYKVVSPSQVL